MFNSTKVNNSPRTKNTDLYTDINETANGISRSFLQPKITSTPLVNRESIFATPPKHSILSPRRYSLSEIATPPRQNRRDLSKIVTTGPLLASTKYNINVSTYEDTKSPGLASRIVQYNEEAERERQQSRPPTHQAKYGSPGLFPVVHLFKKKLPVLEQKPKRVTIRIASPEYSRHHSQEYNRKLLEGIVKPSSPAFRTSPFTPSIQSTSTRSVLDALKEISRKRIHASEEYDLNEDSGKRLRTMNNGDSNKRLRDNSPLDKSPSPNKPMSKRVCMYDEYAASCSSTDFSFKKMELQEPKRKSISISTLTDNPKESKQVKLINAETQTVTVETAQSTEPPTESTEEKQEKTEVGEEPTTKKKSPLKIFDDAPLERIRKNRLAALMGSLTGKEPILLPKPDYATVLNSQAEPSKDVPDASSEVASSKSSEKPLVSILSSPRKPSPTKSGKHVHFSVPESTSQTNFNSTAVSSFPAAAVAPVTTASETKAVFGSSPITSRETPAPPSSPVGLQPSGSAAALPVVTFGGGSNSSSVTSVVSKESSTSSVNAEAPKTGFSIPNFQFKAAISPVLSTTSCAAPNLQPSFSSAVVLSTTAPSNSVASTGTSPPKMGGFKFDLSKPVTTASPAIATAAPTFSFGGAQPNTNKTISNVLSATGSQNAPSAMFSFGAKPATTAAVTNLGLSFATTTTASSLSTTVTASAVPSFTFGATTTENKVSVTLAAFPVASSFGVVTSATNTTASLPVSNTPATSVPAFGTSKAPFFSFGASKTTPASSGFGAPAQPTSAPLTFGAPSTTSNSFGTPATSFLNTSAPQPTPSFGIATTTPLSSSGGFGSPSTTTNAGFGTNTSSMFGASKTVAPFGGGTSAPPAFGSSSTANSSPFSKNNVPQFGQSTTQSTFGTPTTTTSFSSANAFGGTTTTTSSAVFSAANNSSVFGNKTGGFGTPSTNANIFGGPVNAQPSNFGSSASKPMFGAATTVPFATSTNSTTTPSFGGGGAPAFNFGAKTTATSSFGSSNSFGPTTTTNTGFGSSTTPSFGTSNSFGGSTNFGSGSTFGSSTTPAFGVATTTTQPSGFGNTTAPTFGTAGSGFNSVEKNPVFGSSSAAPAFGNTTTSPFGAPTSTTGFGSSGFGTNTAVSAFSKPQTAQNPFGAPTSNSFGANNSFGSTQPAPSFGSTTSSNAQNTVFSFGATAPTKPPGVFSFGASGTNEVPKPNFNFTGGSTAPPAFGSSAAPSFGGGGAVSFGAPGVPQFGSPQPGTQGMFSIGSGSSTGKARTHLKPKRRGN